MVLFRWWLTLSDLRFGSDSVGYRKGEKSDRKRNHSQNDNDGDAVAHGSRRQRERNPYGVGLLAGSAFGVPDLPSDCFSRLFSRELFQHADLLQGPLFTFCRFRSFGVPCSH